jgi:osmotically inducible protein OsmC
MKTLSSSLRVQGKGALTRRVFDAGRPRFNLSEGHLMPTRQAHARWEGTIKQGKGTVNFGNGAFNGPYSFASRFEEGTGTNPEELLGAAHASCFAMALSLILGSAGFKPDYVDATAHVTVTPQGGGFKISKSHIVCEAKVPGMDGAAFLGHAEAAKAGCPVSQALAGTEITLEAKLAAE